MSDCEYFFGIKCVDCVGFGHPICKNCQVIE